MTPRKSILRTSLVILAVAQLSGCFFSARDDRPARIKVTGTVTYKDAPLAGATVIFQPVNHSNAAVGVTDEAGRFQLRTFEVNDGAVPGEYTVAVLKEDGVGTRHVSNGDGTVTEHYAKHLVPEKYIDGSTSGLTASVAVNQPNDFKFQLTGELPSPPKPRRVREEIE